MNKSKIKKISGVALIFVLLFAISWYLYEYLINSDMAAELILGKLLAKNNEILTKEWCYSTEIRVIYMSHVAAFFFKFCNNFKIVRMLTNVTLWTILFASLSYFFMVIQNKKSFIVGASFFLLPVSINWLLFVLFGGFYTFQIVGMLLYFAWLYRLEYTEVSRMSRIRYIFLMVVISGVMGLAGPRGILIILVPHGCYVIWKILQTKKVMIREILPILCTTFAYGICFLVNMCIFGRTYSFMNHATMTYCNYPVMHKIIDQMSSMVEYLLKLIGFQGGVPLFSLAGFSNFICVTCLVFSFVWIVQRIREFNQLDKKCKYLIILFLGSMGVNVFFNVFIDYKYEPRYYLSSYVLLVCAVYIWICQKKIYKNSVFKVFGIIMILILCINSVMLGMDYYHLNTKTENENPSNKEELLQVTEYLKENHYELGYSGFWCGDVITELSNGKISFAYYNYGEGKCYPWLTERKNVVASSSRKKKRFGLFSTAEYETFGSGFIETTGSNVVYSNDSYYVVDFSASAWSMLEENFPYKE